MVMMMSSPMMLGRARLLQTKAAGATIRRATIYLGRATAVDTATFVERAESSQSGAKLRLGGEDSHVTVTRRGVGSPYLWAKDMPRIESSKKAVTGYQSNFLQASINPYTDAPANPEDKQSYVESLVLQEVIEDEGFPREALVVSSILEDSLVQPANAGPTERLTAEYIEKGLKIALDELKVEALDQLVVRIPDELVQSHSLRSKLNDTLARTADILESLCASKKIGSYGFALPASHSSSSILEQLLSTTFLTLSEKHSNFSALQLAMPLSTSITPLSPALNEFKTSRDMLIVADKVFEASLSNGKPLGIRSHTSHLGEDVALLLKSAFNLAISIERKYMETIRPENSELALPAVEDVAWAHILANQHSQFDNLEEWIYIRETQIFPRFEVTVKQFEAVEDLKEFGFAYSMALRELLKCFTASVELLDASRTDSMLAALNENNLLVSPEERLEHIAVKAALSAGADAVLTQEQLGKDSTLAFEAAYSPEYLERLAACIRPALVVE
ncbi:hypothetical protein Poli38472_000284 [Pythium oligandrum]|uniref:Uncharacterized protein n=1 Tax=Pythium oligandrum TaxID=41045 RepID=A0A8K1FHY8_PYTOL|nr:hypothetical protein Poli38472_000284 [Pythium oligandrum]|eukprot:TMW60242.1 hypothetical protein Poli38472_000284 [Pythium oligandrum]